MMQSMHSLLQKQNNQTWYVAHPAYTQHVIVISAQMSSDKNINMPTYWHTLSVVVETQYTQQFIDLHIA